MVRTEPNRFQILVNQFGKICIFIDGSNRTEPIYYGSNRTEPELVVDILVRLPNRFFNLGSSSVRFLKVRFLNGSVFGSVLG